MSVVDEFAGFVVGSDQVWRPDYLKVGPYLLDFLPESFEGPRVAYAPSFGNNQPSFSSEDIETTRSLANRLTAVSVREDSGVSLCKQLWEVDAVKMPDPTLLLRTSDFSSLVQPLQRPEQQAPLVTYLLDPSTEVNRATKLLANEMGTRLKPLRPGPPESGRDLRRHSAIYSLPTVEEWISQISRATCIVTDSYHGCIFALVFERPFLVIPNAARGRARFESLLDDFGLADRLVAPPEITIGRMGQSIDWGLVRRRREELRNRGLEYLRIALEPSRA